MADFRLFLFFFFLLFYLQPSRSHESCHPGCDLMVPIHFPFQMMSNPPENRCGYDGFTVTCKNETRNILTFPFSGDFVIDSISYFSQRISITDPCNCIARRLIQGFNYSDTPFRPLDTRNFTFLNCTSDAPVFQSPGGVSPIPCLSSESHSFVALPTERVGASNTSSCTEVVTFMHPSLDDSIKDSILLTWKEPDCGRCESDGGFCQYKYDTSSEVSCFTPFDHGLPKYERYTVFVIVSTGLCIVGFIIIIRRKIRSQSEESDTEISRSTNTSQLENVAGKGLDSPTIKMYPTMVVDESLQLPKPTNNICPICLLEYKANDILRTIPSCAHYFHVHCIDEWLKRNATCPLCRNYY
ncbi:hypothetical protein ES332_D03G105300v1 [Gossypium tomentosum]|uniref:RING-type E3 ubiquitin transferase n=1 Tax=Gossypium tomentosum TaxID=34277 RepID=A0A5D2LLR8_GOSTO|nr:hypothetical protein ES332_D03G105300v1 [Gossypium tomentosum]